MSSRTTNICILVVILLALLSGITSLLVDAPSGRWLFWLHRVAGLSLIVLSWWKWRIVARSYRKRGLTLSTALSALFTLLVIGSLSSGVLWATSGFPGLRVPVIGSLTWLGVQIAVSVALIPWLLLHVVQRWQRARRVDFAGRRAAMRWAGLSAAGLTLWGVGEAAVAIGGLSRGDRRFTGSRERGRLPGNTFPITNWFSDPKPRIDPAIYHLRVGDDVTLSLDDLHTLPQLTRRATLDCAGGWYTNQDWSGVPLSALLSVVPVSGRSIVVRSETGYARRFSIDEAGDLLLATHVGNEPLSRGHGFPIRLVAPGYRGYEWTKWVTRIEFSAEPAWLQSPLPVQ